MGPRNPWDDGDDDDMMATHPGMGPGMDDTPMGYGGPESLPGAAMGGPMMGGQGYDMPMGNQPPMGGYPGAMAPMGPMPKRGNQFVDSLRRLAQGSGQGGPPNWSGGQMPMGRPSMQAPQGGRPNAFMQAFRRR